MGAIERDGYTFSVEYSVMLQKGALHAYRSGQFIKEIPFEFTGQEPSPEKVERLVDTFLETDSLN